MTRGADGLYTRRTAQVVLGGELVYPDLAAGVLLSSGAANWALGAAVEIIPAATITVPFIITRVYFNGTIVELGEYQLDLFYGNPDVALCSVAFNEEYYYQSVDMRGGILGVPIPANSRVRGQLAYALSGGVAVDARICLGYVRVSG